MEYLLPCLVAAVELPGWERSCTSEQTGATSSEADTMHGCMAVLLSSAASIMLASSNPLHTAFA
jgi:hypothetical protein